MYGKIGHLQNKPNIMETIYRIKTSELDTNLLESIRQLFQDDEELTITVVSEKENSGYGTVQAFLELERTYPPRQVSQNLDFNTIVDEMNL